MTRSVLNHAIPLLEIHHLTIVEFEPQLAIKRLLRKSRKKPRWRVDDVAAAKSQNLAIPMGANAVEFFADEIGRGIDVIAGDMGEK